MGWQTQSPLGRLRWWRKRIRTEESQQNISRNRRRYGRAMGILRANTPEITGAVNELGPRGSVRGPPPSTEKRLAMRARNLLKIYDHWWHDCGYCGRSAPCSSYTQVPYCLQ